MEETARDSLRRSMGTPAPSANLAAAIRARIARMGGAEPGGAELDPPPREPMREPPDFDGADA